MPFRSGTFTMSLLYLLSLGSLMMFLGSGPAYAEWVALGGSDSGTTAYVDTGTLRPNGNSIHMGVLYDFKIVHAAKGGSFLSSKAQHEYDCAGWRYRTLMYTRFSGNMGSGNVVSGEPDDGRWTPVIQKSVGHMLWTFACSKE
jgi:hypothetical protein